jgi:hypothetical protein
MASAPGWRNGIRSRLKIGASKGFVGSTPTPGIALIACVSSFRLPAGSRLQIEFCMTEVWGSFGNSGRSGLEGSYELFLYQRRYDTR